MTDTRKLVVVTTMLAVAVTALVAGVMWQRHSSSTTISSIGAIDDLREYESSWRVINGESSILVDDLKNKTVVLNFWGSWCPPCISEMPLLDRFNTEHSEQGVQVVGVVIDREQAAKDFLQSNQIRFPSLIAEMHVTDELMELLGNDDGVLPYTVAFGRTGERVYTHEGPLKEEDLLKLIQ
ncbi:MAG: TlpA disulfide reductase family protein [Acidiferrobacterales bacterium]|nr:TlpA disulfide reductase family protein [Acidiferrobacterales bacterium]